MTPIAVFGGSGPQELKERLHERVPSFSGSVAGATNAEAVELAEVVLLAVPFPGHDDLVADLASRLRGVAVTGLPRNDT